MFLTIAVHVFLIRWKKKTLENNTDMGYIQTQAHGSVATGVRRDVHVSAMYTALRGEGSATNDGHETLEGREGEYSRITLPTDYYNTVSFNRTGEHSIRNYNHS